MQHPRALIAALLCGLLAPASGCHLIFPFGAAPGQDAGVRPPDQRAADEQGPPDAGAGEAGLVDGPSPGEAAAPDAPAPDAPAPDAPLDPCNPTGSCHECEPIKNPACTASCSGTADCDDLPEHRDPWKTTCNKVLFEDDFSDATLAKWNKLYAGYSIAVKTCGLLQIDPPSHTTAEAAVKGPLAQAFLVDVGLTPPPLQDPWSVDVVTMMEEYSPQELDCRLEYQPDKTLWLKTYVTDPAGKSASGTVKQLGALSGQVVLQSWCSGASCTCRLFAGGVLLAAQPVTAPSALKPLGGVHLRVITPQYMTPALTRFDFVRAFSAQ